MVRLLYSRILILALASHLSAAGTAFSQRSSELPKGTLSGGISGTVSAAATGLPIPSAFVNIWDGAGLFVTFTLTAANGTYLVPELAAANYFASTRNVAGFLEEVYDDIPCPGGTSEGCEPMNGSPVSVIAGVTTSGIDFALDVGGSIAGQITAVATGDPIPEVFVDVWSDTGFVGSTLSVVDGTYSVTGLATGTYFTTTASDGFIEELYDDLPCPGGAFTGCIPTNGTLIMVSTGSETSGIDFALASGGSLSGGVIDVDTAEPILNAAVAVFDATGSMITSTLSGADGAYSAGGLPGGTYFAATSTGESFFDELYDNLPCTDLGFPGCDPTGGQPIMVALGSETSGIDFALKAVSIFEDGFESGDLSDWNQILKRTD